MCYVVDFPEALSYLLHTLFWEYSTGFQFHVRRLKSINLLPLIGIIPLRCMTLICKQQIYSTLSIGDPLSAFIYSDVDVLMCLHISSKFSQVKRIKRGQASVCPLKSARDRLIIQCNLWSGCFVWSHCGNTGVIKEVSNQLKHKGLPAVLKSSTSYPCTLGCVHERKKKQSVCCLRSGHRNADASPLGPVKHT